MKENKNNVICIIGMHRSGTSLIARVLNLCGLDLGPSEQFMEPDEGNPLGYFENVNFVYKIDDALLAHFGGSWDNPPPFEEGWEYDPSLEQIVYEARSLLGTFSNSSQWGWKDSRATILLPFWKLLIPDLQFVICVRSPLEVAKSLARRDKMSIQKGVYLWNQYMRSAIRDTEGSLRIFTFYEDFFKDAPGEIKRVVEFCGLQMPDDLYSLYEVITPELKHHTSETLELLDEEKVITDYKLFYIGLRALTTEGFVQSTSDRTREAFESENISKFFKLLEQFHDEQEMAQIQSALADKEQQLTRLHATVHQQQQAQSQKEKQVAQLIAQQEALNQEVQSLQAALHQKDEQISQLQSTVQAQQQIVAELHSQIAILEQAVQTVTAQVSEKEYELSKIYQSKAWRVAVLLRRIRVLLVPPGSGRARLLRRLLSIVLFPWRVGQSPRVEPPLFELAETGNDQKTHLYVETAEIRGRQIKVAGWVFHEDALIDSGVLSIHHWGRVRNVPLTIGIERSDVYYVKDENKNALRSGFHGVATLEGAVADQVFIEFHVVNHSPIRVRVYPRRTRIPPHRILAQAWRTANLRRIIRGVGYVLRGDWQSLWLRLILLSDEADAIEPQPIGLRFALNLVASEPMFPPPLDELVDIIIPVYNGLEYLDLLFESLKRNTRSPHRLIVIDDASTDPQVWPRLQELLQDHPNAVLLRNESNLGFVGTVNRGAAYAKGDFVLLNTDVEVPPHWLERLIAPIREDRRVATTTPFSNAATVCSFPEMDVDNPLFADLGVDRIDRWFARVSTDLPRIDLPSGIGFCMGVNGEAWQRIGPFDEAAFGRGYGEENDWCLRASAAGYRNVMVPNLFVYHKHSGSFESVGRDRLRENNLRIVLDRYPDYQRRVNAFIRNDPLMPFRRLLTLLIACGEAEKPPVLVVDHDLGGGANSYSKKMVEDRLATDQPVLLLTARRGVGLFPEAVVLRCLFRNYAASFKLEDLAVLEMLFSEHLPLGEIFYNNAVSFARPLALIETLHHIKVATGAPLTIAIHDFYPLCPSYTLLDSEGVYSRLPDVSTCRTCLPNNRFAANPERDEIDAWRRTWGTLLGAAERVLCFSEDSRRHVEQVYPDCADRIAVRPHTLNHSFARKPKLNFDAPLHIGVVGTISYPKGAGIVADLAHHLVHADPSARITIIGTMENAPRLPNLRVTGPYKLAELPDLLERHGINVCFLPSIWPETFSYVAEELMALDMPLACFDIGAPAERVPRYSHGLVITSRDVEMIARQLLVFKTKMP